MGAGYEKSKNKKSSFVKDILFLILLGATSSLVRSGRRFPRVAVACSSRSSTTSSRRRKKHDREAGRPESFDFSVRYSDRTSIRNAVLETECAATADMSSWFDQLRMPGVSDLMGVEDEHGSRYQLEVAAMGYVPSCKVAQGTLVALSPFPPVCYTARFVDNISFFGSRVVAAGAMTKFFARTRHCGAVVNDEDKSPRTSYDFLSNRVILPLFLFLSYRKMNTAASNIRLVCLRPGNDCVHGSGSAAHGPAPRRRS